MNLNHPFALDISDLEDINPGIEKQLTDEEADQIAGGDRNAEVTTLAIGEEGGDTPGDIVCISAPCPGSESGGKPSPRPRPSKPSVYTRGWFETGGGPYTKALYETGGSIR